MVRINLVTWHNVIFYRFESYFTDPNLADRIVFDASRKTSWVGSAQCTSFVMNFLALLVFKPPRQKAIIIIDFSPTIRV